MEEPKEVEVVDNSEGDLSTAHPSTLLQQGLTPLQKAPPSQQTTDPSLTEDDDKDNSPKKSKSEQQEQQDELPKIRASNVLGSPEGSGPIDSESKEENTTPIAVDESASALAETSDVPVANPEEHDLDVGDDDDFGDFDDYSSTPQPPACDPSANPTTATTGSSAPTTESVQPSLPEDDPQEHQQLQSFYESLTLKLKRDYSRVKGEYFDALQRAFPLKAANTTRTDSGSIQGLLSEEFLAPSVHSSNQVSIQNQKRLWKPNLKSTGCCPRQVDPSQEDGGEVYSWVKFYEALMGDTVFSMDGGNSRFRWRRSQIRKLFLNSLNVEISEVIWF